MENVEDFQEHEYFTVYDIFKRITINCLLPTRVFEDILKLCPHVLKKMNRGTSSTLNIEDYSVLEKSAFQNAENFLQNVLPRLKYKPFRLSKVMLEKTSVFFFVTFFFIITFPHICSRICYGAIARVDFIYIFTLVYFDQRKPIQL